MTTEELVDRTTAAQVLGVAPKTMAIWACNGYGPKMIRLSARCIRYRLSDIDAWIASRERASTADQGEAA